VSRLRTQVKHLLIRWGTIPLFHRLEIETCSTCNRYCPTCLRNSHPDRERAAPWFKMALLPEAVIKRILEEALGLGFHGSVCLQHYNEPLMDERIGELGRMTRDMRGFSEVIINTNADYITPERAAALDGIFDRIIVALYMDEPKKSEREQWVRGLFTRTRLEFTGGVHIATHYSPDFPVAELAARHRENPCDLPLERMIINHRGEMLLCCDDLVGNFNLGNVSQSSLRELWYSPQHQRIVKDLLQAGGRRKHSYCETCPRA